MASNTDLRVRITADLADIKQGLGLLRGELAKVKTQAAQSAPDTSGWSKGLAGIRQQVMGVAAAYVSWRGISGIVRGVFDSFDKMDRIDEMRQMVALSSEELSKFAYAAQFSGVELEALGKGFGFFQRNAAKNSQMLQKIGVDAPTLTGKLRQLMDVFKELPDGEEKASLAAELFGSKLGGNLIPLLNEGSANFDKLSEAAARTGNVFSDEATAGAAKFKDNLDTLKSTMAGVFNVAAQQLAPAMAALGSTTNAAAQQSNAAAEGGKFLANVFKVLAVGGVIVKNVIEAVVGVIGLLSDVAIQNSKIIIASLGGAFTTVGATMKSFMTGGPLAALATFTTQVQKNAGAVMGATRNAQNQLRGSFDAMRSGFKEASSDVANAFVGAFSEVDASGAAAKKAIGAVGDEADTASKKGEGLRKMLASLLGGGAGKDGKDKANDKAKEAIKGLADQSALSLDQVERDLATLQQRFEDKQVTVADYFAQRQALELQRIDIKLAEAQADALSAKSSQEQSRALTDIIKLQRDRAAIGPATAREQAKAEKEAARAAQQARDEANAGQIEAANRVRNLGFASIRGFFTDMIDGTVKFKDAFREMVRSFAAGLAQMAAEALAKNIAGMLFGDGKNAGQGGSNGGGLLSGFVSFLGGLFGGGSANGNVFDLSGVRAFANGGAFTNSLVDSPTLFAFGKGGQFGVMGEAGPEAVMPLTRGPGGRLGVDASGGGSGKDKRPIVVFSERQLQDAMAANGGLEDLVVYYMDRNRDRFGAG